MLRQKISLIVLLLICQSSIFSQENENKNKFELSGSIDTYFSKNVSTNALGTTGILSDKAANGFGLGMINTVLSYKMGKAGAVGDLAYGPRANAANAYEGAINQLYAYYNASDKVKISLGQFNTFYGYEVISPVNNFNYSVSYLFNAGPFSHTGVKVEYQATEDVSLLFAITNPHGITDGTNTTNEYQYGFQIGYSDQFFNVAYGADGFGFNDVLYLDYTGGFDIAEKLYIGVNAAYANSNDADAGYYGAALYIENSFSNTFALGLRPEYFVTTSGAADNSIFALTLAANKSLTEKLKVIAELRYDSSKDVTLIGGKESVTGVTLAAVYSF